MEEYLTEAGIAIILMLLVGIMRKLKLHFSQSDDLHEWHKPDSDGRFPWYKSEDMHEVLSKLTECMSNQTDLLKAIHSDMKETRKVAEESRKFQIERAIDESKS